MRLTDRPDTQPEVPFENRRTRAHPVNRPTTLAWLFIGNLSSEKVCLGCSCKTSRNATPEDPTPEPVIPS